MGLVRPHATKGTRSSGNSGASGHISMPKLVMRRSHLYIDTIIIHTQTSLTLSAMQSPMGTSKSQLERLSRHTTPSKSRTLLSPSKISTPSKIVTPH
eukprot:1731555-Amphidinium_carterae.1